MVVTYNGSTERPTQIGSYTVKATIQDRNFTGNAVAVCRILPVESVLGLAWPTTTNEVTVFQTTDLEHWTPLATCSPATKVLWVGKDLSTQFFKAVVQDPAGPYGTSLTLTAP